LVIEGKSASECALILSIGEISDSMWKVGAEFRASDCLRRLVKSHFAKDGAEPNFFRAGVKIEGHLFAKFLLGVARRSDLDANLWTANETGAIADFAPGFGRCPGDVHAFDAVCGGDGAFDDDGTLRQEFA